MKLKLTHSIDKAAVKSGFSCATGYRINKDSRHPSQKPKVPRGRRRSDPLAGIFEEQVVPMLEKCPNLRAVAVYREVMRLNPQLAPGVRRTLERRIRDWRAQHGAQQEVIFRQRQEPGRMGISDFTDMNRIGVTIGGCKFDHKLYHFRLAWSGFTHPNTSHVALMHLIAHCPKHMLDSRSHFRIRSVHLLLTITQ